MALEHAGEAVAHLGRGLADRHRAGHVGGAVEILRARIEQIEGAGFEPLFGLRHRPVVDDGAVRPGAGDRRKAQIAEIFALAAKGFEPVAGGDLGEAALRRLLREPGEKAGQCRAVAAVRRAGAVDLDPVLARLGQGARIGGAVELGPGRFEPVENPRRGTRRIGLHPSALAGERIERRPQLIGLGHGHRIAEMAVEAGGELAAVDEQGERGVVAQDGEGQRQRRVRHVAAADVEEPGDRFRASSGPPPRRLPRPGRGRAGCVSSARPRRQIRRDAAPPGPRARPADPARPGRAGCRRPRASSRRPSRPQCETARPRAACAATGRSRARRRRSGRCRSSAVAGRRPGDGFRTGSRSTCCAACKV